jgi:uncharacterized protein
VLLWLALSGQPALAEVAVPPLAARVTDLTGTLTAAQRAALEQELARFEASKGSQIAVLIVSTTAPETIEQYGIRVAEVWKLGRKGVDDGALLLVARDDRALRIEVGYGLEGAIPDAVAKRVISEIILPYFRQGDFYGGIRAGVDRLVRLIDGELLPEPKQRDRSWSTLGENLPALLFLVLVLGGVLRTLFGSLIGASVTGGVVGVAFWLLAGSLLAAVIVGAIAFLFTLAGGGGMGQGGLGGRYRGPGTGGGFGGGFGGGSLGGGGFSGGGGGFGGGGASGRW